MDCLDGREKGSLHTICIHTETWLAKYFLEVVMVSISVVINTMTKKQLGEEKVCGFFQLTGHPQATGGSRARNFQAVTEAAAAEDHCLLACPSWLAQPAFS